MNRIKISKSTSPNILPNGGERDYISARFITGLSASMRREIMELLRSCEEAVSQSEYPVQISEVMRSYKEVLQKIAAGQTRFGMFTINCHMVQSFFNSLPDNKGLLVSLEEIRNKLGITQEFNTLLSQQKRGLEMLALFRRRKEGDPKFNPDVFTYNSLIWNREVPKAIVIQLLQEMKLKGINPNGITFRNLQKRGDMSQEKIKGLTQKIFG